MAPTRTRDGSLWSDLHRPHRLIADLRRRVQNVALDTGFLDGHRAYRRFIILARPRTGSNLLRSSLDRHPSTEVYGELFVEPGCIGWHRWPVQNRHYGQSRRLVSVIDADPGRFLETQVFRRRPPSVHAAGFKLFYHHAREPGRRALWPYLASHEALHVVHLKRKNLLATHCSHVLASTTKRWLDADRPHPGSQPDTIYLDPDTCADMFERTRALEAAHDDLFADHPMLEVFYEDLEQDFRSTMERVQTFLGLVPEELAPQTRKQQRRPLAEVIENYGELAAHFRGTPWASFFDSPAEP